MLGQRDRTRWVIQPKIPVEEGKYTYLKFDTDNEGSYHEEVEDVFEASHFLSEIEAQHALEEQAFPEQHQVLQIFIKESAAIHREWRIKQRYGN